MRRFWMIYEILQYRGSDEDCSGQYDRIKLSVMRGPVILSILKADMLP